MDKQTNYKIEQPKTGGGENTMKSSSKIYRLLFASTVALLSLLLFSVGVNAGIDCNLTVPASGGVINKFTQLNATFNISGEATNNVSVAFETRATTSVISSPYLTANTSWVVIANVTNMSNLRHANLTFADSYHFGDGTYQFRATCILNASADSGGQHSGVSSTVTATIDRSAPTCSFASALASRSQYAPTQKWSVLCENATSATLQLGSNSLLSMTKNTDTCTYTGDKSSFPSGSYSALVASITDGYNTTACQLDSIRIDQGAPLKEAAILIQSQGSRKTSAQSAQQAAAGKSNGMLMLLIIGGVALWYVRKKNK